MLAQSFRAARGDPARDGESGHKAPPGDLGHGRDDAASAASPRAPIARGAMYSGIATP